MAKKLHYFNINALAEPIRYILHYTKQEFEDIRHDIATWPDVEFKKTLPFGKMPLYVEGDKVLNQSLAIAKYVARDSGLIPADAWQQAVLDSTVLNIYDYWNSIMKYFQEKDEVKKEALKKVLFEETVDFFFSRFEKQLVENGGYFIGSLSWVEFVLVGIVEYTILRLGVDFEKYPKVKDLVDKVTNLPGVKEYIAARGPYPTLPFGQLPIYVEGDKVLNQSLAITKYVARDTDLIPADAWQQAVLDSAVLNIYDYWKSIGNFVHESDPVKRQALQKVIEEETIDFYFSRFEKHLEENGGYFIGKLSWAEFVLCALIEGSNVFLGIEVEKNYPLVKELVEKVKNLPGVKEYIATRSFAKFEF
ncbi:unnamed protein product [Chrysodeixis includens]|uniref:glutathione transferase n=1 Tax=Chrysodeixis includens TaxID=689277 RepID=A0A9N8L273_CHRIL|nr:unnamed protein product [Chrysodeixis includens]